MGTGTVFSVVLPVARASASQEAAPVTLEAAARRRGRILVVDDEPMIARVIQRILAHEHEVVVTSHAAEALERTAAGERFDVILCDLMMPQMTGMELHAKLWESERSSAERMIFLTGGAFTPSARSFLDGVTNLRVEKPFSPKHLRALVNERINAALPQEWLVPSGHVTDTGS